MRECNKFRFVRFRELNRKNINCDLHLHTNKTDGSAGINEIVRAAKICGLGRIAFTEHVRRDSGWFNGFVDQVRKIRETCTVPEVLVGCEAKALDRLGSIDATEEIIDKCDIVLGSVHRFPDELGGYLDFSLLTKEEIAEIELELSIGLLKGASIDVLAHPGGMYFRQFSVDFPRDMMREIFKIGLDRGVAVEINSAYLGDFGLFLRLCYEMNPYVSIGSDMHYLERLGWCRDKLIVEWESYIK